MEKANPGFYGVLLNNNVNCRLTANERTGFHQYTFQQPEGYLRFDMGFRINWDKSTDGMLQVLNDSTLVGFRYSTGWAKGQKVYFAARFSSAIKDYYFVDDTAKNTTSGLVSLILEMAFETEPSSATTSTNGQYTSKIFLMTCLLGNSSSITATLICKWHKNSYFCSTCLSVLIK